MPTPTDAIVNEFNIEFGEAPLTPVDTTDATPVIPGAKSAADPAQKTSQPQGNPPQPVRRQIDLGDGSGVQVFEAATETELIDKLTTAQTNATRKIRQLNQQLKKPKTPVTAVVPVTPVTALTADELFTLTQEFDSNPLKVHQRLLEASLGMSVDALKAKFSRLDSFEQERAYEATAQEFVGEHTADYKPTKKNERALTNYLESEGLDFTKDNLEYAFTELSTSGLLDKPEPPKLAAQPAAAQTGIQPAAPQKPASSGISDRDSAVVPEAQAAQAVEEAYRIPLHELRERIQRRAYQEKTQPPTQ